MRSFRVISTAKMADRRLYRNRDEAKEPEVVSSLRRCRQVVLQLMTEDVISLDCEGDCLSATGQLTLVQISTSDHTVFLFDILADKRILEDQNGLRKLMETEDVIKVLHASESDSVALYHQFGIELVKVFDPQIADMILQEQVEDVLFPIKRNLEAINVIYGGKANAHKSDKNYWGYVSDYWCQRPLTGEMIEYASSDVTALIPDVYNKQFRLLRHYRIFRAFYERVQESIRKSYDPDYKGCTVARSNERFEFLVKGIKMKRRKRIRNADMVKLLNDDECRGILKMQTDYHYDFDIPSWIFGIRNELMYQNLIEIQEDIENIECVDVGEFLTHQLRMMARADNIRRVRTLAREIMNALSNEWLRRIDKRQRKGKPITISEKMHVITTHPDYAPPFHERLLVRVIRDVEREIRERVEHIEEPHIKLDRLAAFHKKFLARVRDRDISEDTKELKLELKESASARRRSDGL